MSIKNAFIRRSSDLLGDTENGLSTSQIVELCSEYGFRYDVNIPYTAIPLPQGVPNKRSALYKNLLRFTPEQQFVIIRELCEHGHLAARDEIKELKFQLISRYGADYGDLDEDVVDYSLVSETKTWLASHESSNSLYLDAVGKLEHGLFQRNLLDDLRLSLELLLKSILSNQKTLENNKAELGRHLQSKDISPQLRNMIISLISYYCDYQNTYVKHNDNVNESEVTHIFELTSTLLKTLSQLG